MLAKSPWHTEKKKMASINQHSWTVYLSSLLCAAGPNPDRDRAVMQQCRLRHSTLLWEKPINWCFREMSLPIESLTFPLSHPLPLVPPQYSGQEAPSLRRRPSIHLASSNPIHSRSTCMKTSVHIWSDIPFCCKWSHPSIPTHEGGSHLKRADTFLHNNLPILKPRRRSKFNWAVHLELFYNYTITAEMHFCMLRCLPQFTALFIQFNSGCLFRGCKFGSFGFEWTIIAHIEIHTFLREVCFQLVLIKPKEKEKSQFHFSAHAICIFPVLKARKLEAEWIAEGMEGKLENQFVPCCSAENDLYPPELKKRECLSDKYW